MTATVLRGDARHLPLADNTVDLVVTSPPYFGLRSYQDGGTHYSGQLGDEPTPAEFVDALLDVTRECVRVLKPSGSLWVNLGDKYSGAQAQNFGGASRAGDSAKVWAQTNPANTGVRAKSLIGVPWRYALRCIDDLGLILRAEVIWSKPNGLPESVTDRVRRSHETWFHFTREPRYFSAVDEVRESYHPDSAAKYARGFGENSRAVGGQHNNAVHRSMAADGGPTSQNPLGKLPGSVWTIPTQPLQVPAHLGVDHFAAFPMEWPRRIIRGWSPSGICVECGEGRRPVRDGEWHFQQPDHPVSVRSLAKAVAAGITPEIVAEQYGTKIKAGNNHSDGGDNLHESVHRLASDYGIGPLAAQAAKTATKRRRGGEACSCPAPDAPTRPGVVLDPFGGTGTTALVASALGRHGISVDRSADYCRLAAWRTTDPGQRAAAMQVEKPPAQLDGQLGMFEEGVA